MWYVLLVSSINLIERVIEQVAHVVARHGAEKVTRHFLVLLAELFVLTFFYAPDLVRTASTLFLELPFSRRYVLVLETNGFAGCKNFCVFMQLCT